MGRTLGTWSAPFTCKIEVLIMGYGTDYLSVCTLYNIATDGLHPICFFPTKCLKDCVRNLSPHLLLRHIYWICDSWTAILHGGIASLGVGFLAFHLGVNHHRMGSLSILSFLSCNWIDNYPILEWVYCFLNSNGNLFKNERTKIYNIDCGFL